MESVGEVYQSIEHPILRFGFILHEVRVLWAALHRGGGSPLFMIHMDGIA